MTIRYEALDRVKEILDRTAYNYKAGASYSYTARGCEKFLKIARILNGFAEKVAEEMEEERKKENEKR